jgi:hypothetical protein
MTEFGKQSRPYIYGEIEAGGRGNRPRDYADIEKNWISQARALRWRGQLVMGWKAHEIKLAIEAEDSDSEAYLWCGADSSEGHGVSSNRGVEVFGLHLYTGLPASGR